MEKEEAILFPWIRKMESAFQSAEYLLPPFGTVRNPISVMIADHEAAGRDLKLIRNLT